MDLTNGWCHEEFNCKAYETWKTITNNSGIFDNKQQNEESELSDHQKDHNSLLMDLNKRKNQQTSSSLCQQKQINKASVRNLNPTQSIFLQNFSSKPWIHDDFKYDSAIEGLHQEILEFYNYISPTYEENYLRNDLICRLKKLIERELPDVTVEVFGSFRTGLFLPTSDIDIVVLKSKTPLPLNLLRQVIIRECISDHKNVIVLDRATVPLIKITESTTDLKIDISFDTGKNNGVNSADLIKEFESVFPSLRPLVMVLKQFVLQWDYNEVYQGGISSYSLILMTMNFLQLHPRVDEILANKMKENLGVLLIEFFELYCRKFNYDRVAIRTKDGGLYLAKDEIRKKIKNCCQFSIGQTGRIVKNSNLCIEDPLDDQNDIGKGSYDVIKVEEAFRNAYLTLCHAVLPQNSYLLKNDQSILGRIIRITKEIVCYRFKLKNIYDLNNMQRNNSKRLESYNRAIDSVGFFIADNNRNEKSNNHLFINNNVKNNLTNNKTLLSLSSCHSNFSSKLSCLISLYCLK